MAWVLAMGRSLGAIEINPDAPQKMTLLPPSDLLLHSLEFSLFRKDFLPTEWCRKVKDNIPGLRPDFFTVHYGADWWGETRVRTFLPLRPTEQSIGTACDRLKFLQDQFQCPVGIENLALATSREDCFRQLEVIETICDRVGGYQLLDLHNLYCQSVNFDLGLTEFLAFIDRQRVLEVHVSGGSVYKNFRRDTHDGEVPEDLWAQLPQVLAGLPRLRWVLFEELPTSFLANLLTATQFFQRLLPRLEALSVDAFIPPRSMPGIEARDPTPHETALEVVELLAEKWRL